MWEGSDAHAEAQRFCDLWQVDGAVLMDETGDYTRTLGIRGVPTNVFVGADGIVRAVGATTPEELRVEVDRLLAEHGLTADG